MSSLLHDLRFALRLFRKSPGFTVAVVASLSLGIGANTAIFTLMDAVMWRLLPVSNPESLLAVGRQDGSTVSPGFTYGEYRVMRDGNSMAELAGYSTAPINVSVDGPPEPSVQGQLVSGNYFALLGVSPIVGRSIGPDDDRVPNGHPVAMLSHGYWERRFARDASIAGRTIRLSGTPFTIVGVTPREFFGVDVGTAPDVFMPLMMQPTVMPAYENLLEHPIVQRTWVQVIARTNAGITPEQAAAPMDAVLRAQEANAPGPPAAKAGPPPNRVVLAPASAVSALRRQFSRPLFVLLAMVGVVLLTACANTANLLLARGAARRPEFAMRLALGAGRRVLIRQLLIESVTLAALGGILGVLLARWATQLLVVYLSSGRTPLVMDLAPNVRILAFTATVSVLTGLLFGLAPAWRSTRIDLTPALKNLRSSLSHSLRPGRVLAVVQLALSLLLLATAGLFVRSLHNMNGQDMSVSRQSVLVLRVEPKGSDQRGIPGTTERLDRTYRELIRRVRDIRGVEMASMANSTPTAPTSSAGGLVPLPSGERVRIPLLMVYPDYFATVGMPIVSGRDFATSDLGEQAPAVCIVNEAYVRKFVGAGNPIGRTCYTGRRARLQSTTPTQTTQMESFQIVGVVQDSRYTNPRGETQPLIYMTFLQTSTGRGQMLLHLRVTGNPGLVVQRVREEVSAIDAAMPMFDVHTLEEEMNAALVQQRLVAMLSTLFGAVALVLACVGLYGLLSFTLVQRMSEMGIRMALGARRRDVVWLVVSDALMLVLMGIALGVPAAFAVARLAANQISGLIFGLQPVDPAVLTTAVLVLATVAAVAVYLPAFRASRVDPMVVLRVE
jgi:putative ABC transport system permease protein